MSSSAGNDIGAVLLCDGRLCHRIAEKGCKRRDFVGRALNADDRWAVGRPCAAQHVGQLADVVDVYRQQSWEHRGQPCAETAWPETVVAVAVPGAQPLSRHGP